MFKVLKLSQDDEQNGQPIGLRTSLLRSAMKFVPWELAHFTIWHIVIPSGYPDDLLYSLLAAVYGLVFIYLISPLWSKSRQTVYDSIVGTVVRYEDSADSIFKGGGKIEG